MKSFLFRSIMGIFFGGFVAAMTVNVMIYFGGQEVLDGDLFLKNSIGCILCGWLFTVTPLFFEIRSISLQLQTALHFLTVTILYFILAIGIGWIPFDITNILLFLAISITVYAVMWLCFYLYFRYTSRKLNNDLKHIE